MMLYRRRSPPRTYRRWGANVVARTDLSNAGAEMGELPGRPSDPEIAKLLRDSAQGDDA